MSGSTRSLVLIGICSLQRNVNYIFVCDYLASEKWSGFNGDVFSPEISIKSKLLDIYGAQSDTTNKVQPSLSLAQQKLHSHCATDGVHRRNFFPSFVLFQRDNGN